MKKAYEVGEIVVLNGTNWVIDSRIPASKSPTGRAQLVATCLSCGFRYQGETGNFTRLAGCRGCKTKALEMEKPAALKKDADGNCITICRTGQLEHIHKLITDDGLSETAAAQSFINACQQHSEEGDPLTSDMTVEQIRKQYRRDIGKDKPKQAVKNRSPRPEPDVTCKLTEQELEEIERLIDSIRDSCSHCHTPRHKCSMVVALKSVRDEVEK